VAVGVVDDDALLSLLHAVGLGDDQVIVGKELIKGCLNDVFG